jgi:predicted phosphodiesterase
VSNLRATGRPLLCLSDVHGDLWALESVLAAVKHLDLCGIVVAGDHCVGGSQPFEVYTRLVSLGAHMARGPSDLALGALAAGVVDPTPTTAIEEARLVQFLRTKKALGDVVCRRLADLPSTLVVSLDDTSGVMAMHGSPADDSRGLVDDDTLADQVACVAEDVLVTGATHEPFARAVERLDADARALDDDDDDDALLPPPPHPLLVVNCGSVGMSPTRRKDLRRTAHAVLLAPCDDGRVHAWSHDVLIVARARARSVG